MDVIVICGAAGVGKSTLAWEIGRQLVVADVSHAIVDTDELDRVYPQPKTLAELVGLTCQNLKSLWDSFAALGHTRLILSGVMLDVESDMVWIRESLDDARVTVVRLIASDETLRERIEARETGSGKDEHLVRSLRQSEEIRRQSGDSGAIIVDTDGRRPETIARDVLLLTAWGT